MLSTKLRVLVTRAVFPSVIDRLSQHFDVECNNEDALWGREELLRRAEGKDGVFVFGTEKIDAEFLARSPRLKIAANMTVGYNNFDVQAMNAAGVLGTNAPDVLTESTVSAAVLPSGVSGCDGHVIIPGRFRVCASDGDCAASCGERAFP
jgi:gluconate 2-dehydrogenase